MTGLFYLLALVLVTFVLPVLMYRRMCNVRDKVYAEHRQRNNERPFEPAFVDEKRAADGTYEARPTVFDEDLLAADKAAAALPDIDKTLQGKR